MKDSSYHILRVFVAITFLWIGVLIFKEPEFWGSFLQPWAANILNVPIKEVMIATAVLDFLVGFFLLIDRWSWIAALVGSFHLVVVLVTSGINAVTVRDIGLLGATIAITWTSLPPNWKKALQKRSKQH